MTIKELRFNANLNTNSASSLLGISKSMLYKIEEGKRNPSFRLLKRMSEVYKCGIEEIAESLG